MKLRLALVGFIGFLEHARETRLGVPKISLFGTPRWLAPCKTSSFGATGVPQIGEFAP